MPRKLLIAYYAATALFVSLDFGLHVNVRAAFLDGAPGLRAFYYLVCFACLLLILWRPAWTALIGALESLFVLAALIVGMGLRSMVVTDAMLETGAGAVTPAEVVNFLISGLAAYLSYLRGIRFLEGRRGTR